jgi:hypothetical protein
LVAGAEELPKEVDPKDVVNKMRFDYARGVRDHSTRALEAVCDLCGNLEKQDLNVDVFLKQAAELISKHFGISSIAIGVRDPIDKLYKYKVVVGLDDSVAEGYKSLTYTRQQLFDDKTYPSYEISPRTKLFLSENHPYADGEEFTYRRPQLIGMKRRSLTDSLEADYLDFLCFGTGGEILGFIEASGTRLRKLPDATTIKWLEMISCIIGAALRAKRY